MNYRGEHFGSILSIEVGSYRRGAKWPILTKVGFDWLFDHVKFLPRSDGSKMVRSLVN